MAKGREAGPATGRRVLVTGASRDIGGRLVRLLAADPSVEQVIGVDTIVPPGDLGRAEFVRADIRNPLISKVMASAGVDTVVHLGVVAQPVGAGGRAAMKETNVIGTMQLLAACQKSAGIRSLVVKSTASVYGTHSRDPARFTEDAELRSTPTSGFAKDAVEVEGYIRGFARRRPDVALTVLRFSNIIGPRFDTSLTRWFAVPVAPTVLGFDPRLQLCHVDDALAVLRRAIDSGPTGVFNVSGDGVLLLSQALRRLGRPSVPVPTTVIKVAGRVARRFGVADFSPEHLRFFEHGRCVDTTRLKTVFGYDLRYDTESAFEDFAAAHPGPLKSVPFVGTAENALLGLTTRVGDLTRRSGAPADVAGGAHV